MESKKKPAARGLDPLPHMLEELVKVLNSLSDFSFQDHRLLRKLEKRLAYSMVCSAIAAASGVILILLQLVSLLSK